MSNLKTRGRNFPRQVLVVDDEDVNRQMLGFIVSRDYKVFYAKNGLEAMEQIRKYRDTLSLVLLDLLMPEMDGFAVLEAMREEALLSKIPVIVLTSEKSYEIKSLQLGAVDFITKPYDMPDVILARVQRSIELSEDNFIIQTTERDELTGLYSREFFFHYCLVHDQHYPDQSMDTVVLNVNHFRMFNELYGKSSGDKLLQIVAEQIRQLLSGTDGLASRSEADTFLIYLPHRERHEEILDFIYEGFSEMPKNTMIRLRMGVYLKADKKVPIEQRFDRAMLSCHSLRNNYTVFVAYYDDAMHEKELYSERLIGDVEEALERHQFHVYFQPKYDIKGDKPVLRSAEALIRWIHPEYGMISPGVFIPLFEENGLIQQLDQYVWRQTAWQIRAWRDRYGVTIPVSVNVSRVDMYDPDIKKDFLSLIEEFGLSTEDYMLEITESAYTDNSDQIVQVVHELREDGFRIEMDDFGSGYSSLNMLSSLPIDALKLDMKFIRNIANNPKDMRMVELMMQIAEMLDVPVIAEGVEDEEQYRLLKSVGCDVIQGYYFSRPVPAEEFEKFIQQKVAEEKSLT